MTLQRLTRDQPNISRLPLRAKTLSHDHLATITRGVGQPLDLPSEVRRSERTPSSIPPPAPRYDALVAEVAHLLASTLDYRSVLPEVVRIVAERLECGCVIDLLGPDTPAQIAHLSERADHAVAATHDTLAPLVADVVARRRIAAAASSERSLDGRRPRHVAERARQAAAAPWLVCAPLVACASEPFGALTVFGGSAAIDVPQELVRDLAERIAFAIRNGRAYRTAVEACRERQHVLSLVAHELKNPLGVILMGAAQQLDEAPQSGPCSCRRRELDAIYRSAKRMKKIVGDLLDLASIDAGKMSVRPAACDVAPVIAATLHDIAPAARLAGVELVDDQLPSLPRAWVDADRLSQVLVNLITNATKFTPRGGRVRVRCAAVDDTELVVAVEDSGRGIASDDLARIFDQFWQAEDTAELGSGLGLAICKSIVELSGGRIWAQSTVGIGTTVYFTVPTTKRNPSA
jgi:signal transduction histidine kinase